DRFRQLAALQLILDFIEVLDFWFGAPDSRERGRPRKLWFQKSEPFDAEVRRRFLATWERVARGELGTWRTTPLASLALVVRLDPEDVRSARRHYEIIARFGRFPHRNAALRRESTAEEIEFLRQPGSSF